MVLDYKSLYDKLLSLSGGLLKWSSNNETMSSM